MLRVMPQSQNAPHEWKEAPKDWAEKQAHRVAMEVRRLRSRRSASAQWLADRTAELGYPVTRSVISDLEIGRRRYVTTAELIVLALALDTAPIALMYPAPYLDKIQALPARDGGRARELETILAVQWFSGLPGLDLDHLGMPIVDQMNYQSHLLALNRARKAFALDERKQELSARLALRRRAKREGLAEVTDEEIDELVAEIEDLQSRIDELWKLGGRDLNAEIYDEMFGDRGKDQAMAGRPPLRIGQHGKITRTPLRGGVWLARCRFRDLDGVTRRVERMTPAGVVDEYGARAEEALRDAIAARRPPGSGEHHRHNDARGSADPLHRAVPSGRGSGAQECRHVRGDDRHGAAAAGRHSGE